MKREKFTITFEADIDWDEVSEYNDIVFQAYRTLREQVHLYENPKLWDKDKDWEDYFPEIVHGKSFDYMKEDPHAI